MSRRSRRNRSEAPAKQTPTVKPEIRVQPQSSESKDAAFAHDYVYVYEDIKSLGVTVVAMVVVTIGLSFII